MPLGTCDRCRSKLRFGSGTCTRCGTKKRRAKYLIAAVVVVEAAVIVVHMQMPHHGPHFVSDASASPSLLALDDTARPPAGWMYYETRDEMIGDTTRHARVLSLGKPSGPNGHFAAATGVLELRRSPTYGSSVLISLRRAPNDTIDEHCLVRVTFDGAEPTVFQATAGADTANTTVIIDDAHGFVGKLAAAQSVSLDLQLSGGTERVASFPVGGLKWD